MKDFFDLKRFIRLIKNELYMNIRSSLVSIIAIATILTIFNWISMYASNGNWDFHFYMYVLILFLGGSIKASLAFNCIHDKGKKYVYLMMPCSMLEKFLTKLLTIMVGYPLITGLFYFLFMNIIRVLNIIIFHSAHPFFHPFRSEIVDAFFIYVIAQSIFLFGSVFFKKHCFIKTILIINAFEIFTLLFVLLSIVLVYHDFYDILYSFDFTFEPSTDFMEFIINILGPSALFFLKWLLAPLFWIITYFHLKEEQL